MVAAAAEEPSRRRRIPSLAENRTASRSLHNFSFPPTLSWRNQRHLRCVNLTTANLTSGSYTAANLTSGNYTAANLTSENYIAANHPAIESSSADRPWNLRSRRSNPNRIPSNPNPNSDLDRSLSASPSPPSPMIFVVEKGKRFESGEENDDKGQRCNFAIGLKREEIEEDFVKMKGSKPPRRPKKRAKNIQKQLDLLFPGFWLSEITPDLYKIDVEKS